MESPPTFNYGWDIIIEKAVEDYEKYLEEIREKLKKAFMKRRADRKIAEYLADEVMKEI